VSANRHTYGPGGSYHILCVFRNRFHYGAGSIPFHPLLFPGFSGNPRFWFFELGGCNPIPSSILNLTPDETEPKLLTHTKYSTGRDAARAYATGCFQTHLTHDIRGLDDTELRVSPRLVPSSSDTSFFSSTKPPPHVHPILQLHAFISGFFLSLGRNLKAPQIHLPLSVSLARSLFRSTDL